VTAPVGGYGGWGGANSCGWFILQRSKGLDTRQNGSLLKSLGPEHPKKCEQVLKDKKLARHTIFKQGSYLKKEKKPVAAVTVALCETFLNYDPTTAKACDPSVGIPAGTSSGKGALGAVPSGQASTATVDGFGVWAKTKDGSHTLVSRPDLDPTNHGYKFFWVPSACVKFDHEVIGATNGDAPAAKSFLEVDEGDEIDHAGDFIAMETHSESHQQLHSSRSSRGNYPGWSSLLELHAEEADAQLPAAAPAPSVSPVALNVPPPSPNVQHIHMAEHETRKTLPAAKTGIRKVHVHVYGKTDIDVDRARRLKNMVKRLSDNRTESYDRINRLLKRLKRCGAKKKSKKCLRKITSKLEDWKADFLEPK